MRQFIARSVLALVFAAAPARAAFEETGAGARAPGLGDAFAALADDVYALHYNPAGLAQLDRAQFATAYAKLYDGLSDGSDIGLSQLAYARPLRQGRQGTLGLSWDRFSLSGLYQEQTLTAAYARLVRGGAQDARLYLGAAAKYLQRSFTPGSEASNACSGAACTQGLSDPALTGARSKGAADLDVGVLYRFPRRLQAGLSLQHVMSPNVAFSGSDKLERAFNAGLAYKSLWLSLIGEMKIHRAADGTTARDAIFAAERYFPTLEHGQFGLRGSLGVGSADWRQFTMGASYRINKIQADYAYLIPVGGVQGQSGSHRVGLSFHFGAPTADEEIGRELLDSARRLREHGPDYGYEYSAELKPQDLSDLLLADVRRLIVERRYRLAQKALADFAEQHALSPVLLRLSNRLALVAHYYEDLPEPTDKFGRTLAAALRSFFYGRDRLAILQASYAYSRRPEDARLGRLLEHMEQALGLKAMRLAADSARGFIEEMLYQIEFANTRGEMERVEALLGDVIALEPENATALERLGSLRYLTGRLSEAIAAWEAAAAIETRERELEALREYLKRARELAASGTPLAGGAGPPVMLPAAAPAAPVTTPASAAATGPHGGDPRDIADLYQKGVEHYARGEYLQASAKFLRILHIDPDNAQAGKALERIERMRSKR